MNLSEDEATSRMIIENALAHGDPIVQQWYGEIVADLKLKKRMYKQGYFETVKTFEKDMIEQALKDAEFNSTKAAKLLDINRTTLLMKMKSLGIKKEVFIDEDGFQVG